MFTLSQYGSAVAMETAFWYQTVEDNTYPIEQFGKVTLNLEKSFRALANMSLLVQYDIELFKNNLRRAAQLRLSYLERIHNANFYNDHHYATGRYAHIVDAIAGGHIDIAQKIHQLSPKAFNKGREYMDDYCFGALLGELTQPSLNISQVDLLLQDYEEFLAGDDPRFVIMQSFRNSDQKQFEKGMSSFIENHEQYIMDAKKKGVLLDAVEIALQRVSEDGICLLNVARQIGLEIHTVYKYCPIL